MTDLPLFASTAKDYIERDRERLVDIASELARKAGAHGITSSDVRIMAAARGVITGAESEHQMNQLRMAAVMRQAGLVATGTHRRSVVRQAKRSLNAVYVLPAFAEGAA